MESGREYNKSRTARGNGLTNTGSTTIPSPQPLRIKETTGSRNPHFAGEVESQSTMTGSMDGVSQVSSAQLGERWGFTAQSGTTIELDDSPGGESINLQHHSGASVKIDPDGAIHLVSSSRKGIGISAPYGDAYMSAAGEILVKGSSLNFSTAGDANFDIGGTFNLVCGSYKLSTNVMDEKIDGSASREITNDSSEVVGGIKRNTIAGDQRVQVSGNDVKDIGGNHTERVTGDSSVNTKGNKSIITTGSSTITSVDDMTITTGAAAKISSGENLSVLAGGSSTYSSEGSASLVSDGNVTISAAGTLDARGDTAKLSGTTATVEGLTAHLIGDDARVRGDAIVLDTADLTMPTPTTASGSGDPNITDATSATAPAEAEEAPEAEVMENTDIVDELTSIRKYPEFPGNAKRDSGDAGSTYTVGHDYTPQADEVYQEYSSKNSGNINPVSVDGGYGDIPDVSDSNRRSDIKQVDPGISIPSAHSSSSKISRFFTLGELLNAKHSHKIPPSIYDTVVAEHIKAAYNVLDPIKERFPDIIITSAYRGNSTNHKTGRAIDLVVTSRSLEQHAEIAAFARDNLPVDQVFLERNTSGRTHVHVRLGSGTPKVLTCGDPKCKSGNFVRKLSVEYLRKKGVK